MLLLLLLLMPPSPSSSSDIAVVMEDLAPPWPSPPASSSVSNGNGINAASFPRTSPSSSSSSPMRFTALHVTMIFIAILLCVIICAIPWDNIKCNGSSADNQNQNPHHEQPEETAALGDEEQPQPQQQQQPASGLTKKIIKSFQLVRYGSSSLREKAESDTSGCGGCWTECMICLSDFRNGQMVRILPHCSHGFHRKCIEQWLHSHTSCPICRNALLVPGSPEKTTAAVPHQHRRHHHQPEQQQSGAHHHHHHHHQSQLEQVVVVDPESTQVEEAGERASDDQDGQSVHSRAYVVDSD
ncbi:RING-H2 finger protein ATL72-like [Selaginella moellendorffii]|nr:RING-H2 finger protein ATL72-like [Selaginella moellendorffii]|eukprot:XP_024533179.1 RING-H2 finger protein ATL72-like [Selaginella moellendorffii]